MATIDIRLLGAFRVDVDGVGVAPSDFRRRHAAALVKLLALAERHRLHREQVIDALWPSEAVDEAGPRLHKAAHYARRALGIANAVVLSGEHVALCPGRDVRVDAHAFEELATRALAAGDRTLAREALDLHGGELLPDDRYEDWAAAARDRLWARYVDLLRLDARWDDLLAIDPGDEEAHLALMRHHAARGDHHAALRQFERLDRALRTELGVAPGPEAVALREQLLAARDVTPPGRRSALVGRDAELATIDAALDDAAAGRGRTIVVTGAPGTGTSSLIAEAIARAGDRGMRIAHAVAARVEGAGPTPRCSRGWRTCAGATRRCSTAWPTPTARRSSTSSPAPPGAARAHTSGCSSRPASSCASGRQRAGCSSRSTTSTTRTTAACA